VYFALLPLFHVLDALGIMGWQEGMPYPFVSEIGALVALPVLTAALARRRLHESGLALTWRRPYWNMTPQVVGFTWLFTLTFLALPPLGESYWTLGGSLMLTATMFVCGVVLLRVIRSQSASPPKTPSDWTALVHLCAVLGGATAVVTLTADSVPLLATFAANVFLTALCEELFFRGYVQTGLHAAFGRRWNLWGIQTGPGLPLAAVMFGCFHLIPSIATGGDIPWPWAIWTAVFGLFAGALRDKAESTTMAWVMHGTLLAVRALGSG
jgi:membrane protease YdiL (CAAX protease family)